MLSKSQHIRYNRHLILKDFGLQAQEKLLAAKVLVIGAGALACPALQYLAAAGVGCIGIVDFDKIELSNLQRQVLYNEDDIGKNKSETAAIKLQQLNPDIHIKVFNTQLFSKNAQTIIQDFEVVIDGTDNFASKYLINDVCMFLGIPLVFGAVLRYEGQIAVFNLEDKKTKISTNYRDLFPLENLNHTSQNCSEEGVLGVLPGMIGVMQATETIKIITGIGKTLSNKILTYQALNSEFYDVKIVPNTNSHINAPKNLEELKNFDYDFQCHSNLRNEIGIEEFEIYKNDEDTIVLDVRDLNELPTITEFKCLQIPLSQLKLNYKTLETAKQVLVLCKSGQRSLEALTFLKEHFPEKKILNLKGGILAWKNKMETINK